MIAVDLVKAVADELRDALKDTKLPIEHHNSDVPLKNVTVYEGFLPREKFNDDAYYPLVLVEWMSTTDELDGANPRSTSIIGLSMGVFAAESYGWMDSLHLTELIRHRLLTRRLIAQKFRLTGEAHFEMSSEQPLPFMYSFATLNYQTFQPVETFP